MEDVKIFVNVGDLLQDLPRKELPKYKERDLLKIVQQTFETITGGVNCNPRKFRILVKKYCDKLKKKILV